MRLRTAGLPEFTTTLTPTDGGLALSISLANDLMVRMSAHTVSNGATLGVANNSATGHHHADAGGLLAAQHAALLAAVTATNLATLITLVNLLRTQYAAHISDAQMEDSSPAVRAAIVPGGYLKRKYHMNMNPAGANPGAYDPFMQFTATVNTGNQPLYLFRHYLNFSLEDPAYVIPSSAAIADVIPYVNDLRLKWNCHTYASMTHYNSAFWQGSANFT